MKPSHISPHIQPISEPLHVFTAVFNPDRSRTRHVHYRNFKEHMADSGAILHTIELVLGDRKFEVTDANSGNDIQLRTTQDMWYKENLQNIAAYRCPDAKYLAFIDADFHMARPDWTYEALHLMQRYPVIQLFTTYSTLGPHFQHEAVMPSFVGAWRAGKRPAPEGTGWLGATGGAWAMTRTAFDTLGGLLDTEIVGSADWYMVFALLGIPGQEVRKNMQSPGCRAAVERWAAKAALLNQRIGCLENHAIHYYHGPYNQRGYETRWKILVKYNFDPVTDLIRNPQGLWQFTGNKPEMENEIRAYLEGRGDDVVPPCPAPAPPGNPPNYPA